MTNPMVSIIIPVYNGSNFLREAIDSALAQTYKNCEIIVVNDGSADGTEDICLSYGSKIRYFKKVNGGVASALNFGIKQMRGEYFSWLSHDDLYNPEKIERQIDALRQDGDMTKIVFGDFEVLNQQTGARKEHILCRVSDADKLTNSVYPVVKHMVSGCVLLIHKSHFKRVGLFDETLRYVQDYDMWFRMFRHRETIYINKVLQTVRIHGDELSMTESSPMKIEERAFWTSIADQLTENEMAGIDGSVLLFLLGLRTHLYHFDCIDEKLDNRIKKAIAACNIKSQINTMTAGMPVYIFGAGMYGSLFHWFMRQCGIKAAGFIDNDPAKRGTEIVDRTICISFDDAFKMKDRIFVITAMYDFNAVFRQLDETGFPRFTSIQKIYGLLAKET